MMPMESSIVTHAKDSSLLGWFSRYQFLELGNRFTIAIKLDFLFQSLLNDIVHGSIFLEVVDNMHEGFFFGGEPTRRNRTDAMSSAPKIPQATILGDTSDGEEPKLDSDIKFAIFNLQEGGKVVDVHAWYPSDF
jgi:hypothetical protein